MAVAVARDGAVCWEEAYGLANREESIPATTHTLYALASVSKPFTATALMVLVEEGLVALEAPVNAYLGEDGVRARVGAEDDATIRRLASHTSGLPLHSQAFYIGEPFLPPPFDETIRRYGNLVTAPGERYQYSNLGYGILGHIIEQVSGRSFAQFVKDEVLDPLGMERTTVGLRAEFEGSYATKYTQEGEPIPESRSDCPGASALYSCASDLIRFAMFHLGQRLPDQEPIITDASRQEMQTASPGTVPTREWECEGSGYGLGWFVGLTVDGLRIAHHSGGTHGVSTVFVLVPEEQLAVVVLSNTDSLWPDTIAMEILSALIPERLEHLCMTNDLEQETSLLLAEPSLVGHWAGSVDTYEGSVRMEARIDSSGEVRIRLGDTEEVQLRNVSYTDRMPILLNAGGGPFLRGWFPGDFGTEDVRRECPCKLWLELKLRDQRLTGSLITFSQRLHPTGPLSQWVELVRVP